MCGLYTKNFLFKLSDRLPVLVYCCIFILMWHSQTLGQEPLKENKPKKPRFEISGLTLTDNVSGLMWLLNGNQPHRAFSWDDAFTYIEQCNQERFAGYRDWRVPSRTELETLVDYVRGLGFDGSVPEKTVASGLRSIGLANIHDDGYWSSTVNLYYAAEAWFVNMQNGSADTANKNIYYFVLPVRFAR